MFTDIIIIILKNNKDMLEGPTILMGVVQQTGCVLLTNLNGDIMKRVLHLEPR